MAYINKQQVAERRKKINDLFPKNKGWKFSIRKNSNSSGIICTILKAPLSLNEEKKINAFTYEKSKFKEIYQKIMNILNEENWDNSDPMTDYFDIGWYVDLKIGSYEKTFEKS